MCCHGVLPDLHLLDVNLTPAQLDLLAHPAAHSLQAVFLRTSDLILVPSPASGHAVPFPSCSSQSGMVRLSWSPARNRPSNTGGTAIRRLNDPIRSGPGIEVLRLDRSLRHSTPLLFLYRIHSSDCQLGSSRLERLESLLANLPRNAKHGEDAHSVPYG